MDEQNWTVDYPAWQPQLLAALIERDLEKLKDKVAVAEDALFRRGLELKTGDNDAERAAMQDAARQLRALVVTVLGYPPVPTELESDQQQQN
jgi:hypothetical protein